MNRSISKTKRGLSLIELVTVMAIVSIIAAIAWPQFEATRERSRRTEGRTAILLAQAYMEKCYSKFRDYDNTACKNLTPQLSTSIGGNYNIVVTASTAETYTLEATPAAGGNQTGDDECAVLRISETGIKKALRADATPNDTACWAGNN